jgi:hypothetical protein
MPDSRSTNAQVDLWPACSLPGINPSTIRSLQAWHFPPFRERKAMIILVPYVEDHIDYYIFWCQNILGHYDTERVPASKTFSSSYPGLTRFKFGHTVALNIKG